MHKVRIGFSTLSLFWRSPFDWAKAAISDGFGAIEVLCEGPQWPREADARQIRDSFEGSGLEVYLHSPTVDLNPASVNRGIREETLRQLGEAVDMAAVAGAKYVTTHPGIVHKDKVRGVCIDYAMQVLGEAADDARSAGVTLSIENMPSHRQFLCNTPEELAGFSSNCGCGVTIDVGHAIMCSEPREFLNLSEIVYLHVNDNMGERDQHLCPGEGILDMSMLLGQKRMIIELDDYAKVLKGRDIIFNVLNG
ncbi:MAG TPA: sugar phosphate isomerase/epimerase family protein [Methanocella sp.]|nr:sugar phosphate isomerase/epimerase family protein [Methanocella sp.]